MTSFCERRNEMSCPMKCEGLLASEEGRHLVSKCSSPVQQTTGQTHVRYVIKMAGFSNRLTHARIQGVSCSGSWAWRSVGPVNLITLQCTQNEQEHSS